MKLDRAKLIRAREMLGYGVEKTAEEAGVSKNSVLRAEHEEDIRPVTARKIAAALKVEVRDLLDLRHDAEASYPMSLEASDERFAEMVAEADEIELAGMMAELKEHLPRSSTLPLPPPPTRTGLLALHRCIAIADEKLRRAKDDKEALQERELAVTA